MRHLNRSHPEGLAEEVSVRRFSPQLQYEVKAGPAQKKEQTVSADTVCGKRRLRQSGSIAVEGSKRFLLANEVSDDNRRENNASRDDDNDPQERKPQGLARRRLVDAGNEFPGANPQRSRAGFDGDNRDLQGPKVPLWRRKRCRVSLQMATAVVSSRETRCRAVTASAASWKCAS